MRYQISAYPTNCRLRPAHQLEHRLPAEYPMNLLRRRLYCLRPNCPAPARHHPNRVRPIPARLH